MLPKIFRLPHQDTKALFKNGAKFYYPEMQIICRKKGGDSQMAVLVPVSVCKKATERNRIKRLVREFFRHQAGKLAIPVNIIIIVRRNLAKLKQNQVNVLIMDKFKQIKIA
jgi:ribonuclease P protein component